MTNPRIPPLAPPYPAETGAWLSKWMPPGAAVEPLVLFRTLATHPEFTDRMRPLASAILGPASNIAPRDRELVVLRTCARCGSEYEWGVHAPTLSRGAGLSDALLFATVTATAEDPVWSERERLLIHLADALHDTQRIPDDLWAALREEWDAAQCLELITIAGWYHVISFVANGLALPLESWALRFPAR